MPPRRSRSNTRRRARLPKRKRTISSKTRYRTTRFPTSRVQKARRKARAKPRQRPRPERPKREAKPPRDRMRMGSAAVDVVGGGGDEADAIAIIASRVL